MLSTSVHNSYDYLLLYSSIYYVKEEEKKEKREGVGESYDFIHPL